MLRLPPTATRTYTRLPFATLFRSPSPLRRGVCQPVAMVTPHETGAMRRTTRILAGTAAFASAALVLAGCSGGGSNSSGEYDPDEEVTLEMSWWGDDNRAALFAAVIDMFEAEYPNISVQEKNGRAHV